MCVCVLGFNVAFNNFSVISINLPMYNKNRWGVNSPTRPAPLANNMNPIKDTYRDGKGQK